MTFDEDNDENTPPGGGKMQEQGLGLKHKEFQLKTFQVCRVTCISGPYVKNPVEVSREEGCFRLSFFLLNS